MAKKRSHSSDSESASSSSDEETTKKVTKPTAKIVVSSDSDSSSSDDDDEWNAKPKAKAKGKRGKAAAKKQATAKQTKKKFKPSESSDNESSSSSVSEVEEPKKKPPAKSRNSAASKVNDEREEGEVEDVDDDDNDMDEEFNDGYDENLFGDEDDQRRLSEMTEKEREQELFNRSEQREILRSRFEIERKLRRAKKQLIKPTKKATEKNEKVEKQIYDDALAAERLALDSSGRSVERRRNMEDKRNLKDAIKGLKAEREKKKLKQKLRAADVYSDSSDSDSDSDTKKKVPKKTSSSSSSSLSSSSSDDDSDTDVKGKSDKESRRRGEAWEKGRSSDVEEEKFNFDLAHLNSIRISRFKMEKWCHAPFFNDAVIGAFVRVGIGNVGSAPQYIVGQISDVVVTAKIYNLGKARTNKGIKISYGKNPERTYRLEFVSNSEFTKEEWEKYIGKMAADNCMLPNREFVERKKADIVRACNYQFSDTDVAQIVAEKEKLRRDTPVNFAMRKTQLMKDKEFAEQNNQHERASELKAEIDRLEEVAKQRDTIRTKNIASISYINERNRLRNIKEAEKVIAEAAKEGNSVKDDPFTRQRCAPKMISNFSKNKGAEGSASSGGKPSQGKDTGENGSEWKSSQSSNSSTISTSTANNGATSSSGKASAVKSAEPSEADDLFSAHNFDIKIDFDLPITHNSASSLNGGFPDSFSNGKAMVNGFSETRPNSIVTTGARRSLNLDEYKKKKGLI